jgi:hypothetical protein
MARRIPVTVWLDEAELVDLELLVRHRHGPHSRSAVVRLAVEWLCAKEAGWLVRARRAEERRRQAEAELQAALRTPREERDRLDRNALIRRAVDLVSEQP